MIMMSEYRSIISRTAARLPPVPHTGRPGPLTEPGTGSHRDGELGVTQRPRCSAAACESESDGATATPAATVTAGRAAAGGPVTSYRTRATEPPEFQVLPA